MPKMPSMPECSPTKCPKPHHSSAKAETSAPPRDHGAAHMAIKQKRGAADRGGY